MFNDLRKNEDKGFSLVELIVVIAIMAVMVAVLAPSLLSYVEKSRSQKDDSAMGEVVNAIQIAMSEESVFNEVLAYSCYGNYSCYVDDTAKKDDNGTGLADYKIITKAHNDKGSKGYAQAEQFMYDDEARKDDEVPYHPAGSMRGVTLTFVPEKNDNGNFTYQIRNGIINDMTSGAGVNMVKADGKSKYSPQPTRQVGAPFEKGLDADNKAVSDRKKVEDKATDENYGQVLCAITSSKRGDHYLFNAVKSTVGDSIDISSKTYRNSEYTVFIRIGSVGGKSAGGDSIKVYGQWNGTNLSTAG